MLGILDWDGSDEDAERLEKKMTPAKWCGCFGWKSGWRSLANLDNMNFCAFCGKKLEKG
jgi:hypothetical protein